MLHHKTCHKCGNCRKNLFLCPSCPVVFCMPCVERLGLPPAGKCWFCAEVCCCANKSNACQRSGIHCKRCPTAQALVSKKPPRASPKKAASPPKAAAAAAPTRGVGAGMDLSENEDENEDEGEGEDEVGGSGGDSFKNLAIALGRGLCTGQGDDASGNEMSYCISSATEPDMDQDQEQDQGQDIGGIGVAGQMACLPMLGQQQHQHQQHQHEHQQQVHHFGLGAWVAGTGLGVGAGAVAGAGGGCGWGWGVEMDEGEDT